MRPLFFACVLLASPLGASLPSVIAQAEVASRVVVLEGSRILSAADFHREIARELAFPDYYGQNLDALWDALGELPEGPVTLVWKRASLSRKAMGTDFPRVVEVLRDFSAVRPDFQLVLR